ncbi:MAG: hypothetical protein R3D00_27460 [Bacteroidia bacterium]
MAVFVVLKYAVRLILFFALTILTQVGGVVYVLNFSLYRLIDKKIGKRRNQRLGKVGSFILLYSLTTFAVVPFIAKPLGRVPLPLTSTHHLRPLTVWTCLLNRHYVRPELRTIAYDVAEAMNHKYPGTTTNYLDGNFPFINRFPLIPHLSHNDGKKLDLSFCYNDSHSGEETNDAPSFIGYGICEEPARGEVHTAEDCATKGYWQYSILERLVPQGGKKDFSFNIGKTRALVRLFAGQSGVGKIFIEPHLKTRLNLTSEKIRFHGCHAVRHDDHIHVQLK